MSARSTRSLSGVSLIPVTSVGRIARGVDLAGELARALGAQGVALLESDIIVVSQKIVSKAEGRYRHLSGVTPSPQADEIAVRTGKDPRLVELVLGESRQVLRAIRDVLIVETRLGHIVANAGIDRSNTGSGDPEEYLLLPEDPDASASALRAGLRSRTGVGPGVVISDSFGRPWRFGTTGIAIGTAGPAAVVDLRGRTDLDGKRMETSEVGFADSVAAAAVLVMGETDEACPAVVVRGLEWDDSPQTSRSALRPAEKDLFR